MGYTINKSSGGSVNNIETGSVNVYTVEVIGDDVTTEVEKIEEEGITIYQVKALPHDDYNVVPGNENISVSKEVVSGQTTFSVSAQFHLDTHIGGGPEAGFYDICTIKMHPEKEVSTGEGDFLRTNLVLNGGEGPDVYDGAKILFLYAGIGIGNSRESNYEGAKTLVETTNVLPVQIYVEWGPSFYGHPIPTFHVVADLRNYPGQTVVLSLMGIVALHTEFLFDNTFVGQTIPNTWHKL